MSKKAEIIKLNKPIGQTPLECIEEFRSEHPEYTKSKMTYLGRLDPMAEGLLVILAGNTKDKFNYLTLDKTYEFEVLWGYGTDTYDILGKIVGLGITPEGLEKKMPKLIKHIMDKKTQAYPPYSSKTVSGKPLFAWAKEGTIDEIDIPIRNIKIFTLDHIHTKLVLGKDILEEIVHKISLVNGNFRQNEIRKIWQRVLSENLERSFMISRFSSNVSTGTYIRGLANEMGKFMGTSALAYNIKRTKVGKYTL